MSFYTEFKNNNTSKLTHKFFARFSRGSFNKELTYIRAAKNKFTLSAGYEYLHQFQKFAAENFGDSTVKGKCVCLKGSEEVFNKYPEVKVKKSDKIFKKVEFEGELSASKLKDFIESITSVGVLLMSIKSANGEIKSKTAIPKPDKHKEKFCSLACTGELAEKMKAEFFPDAPDGLKKGTIQHTYNITDIEIPEEYANDPEMARLEAIRIGTLIREKDFGAGIEKEEIKFRA